MKNIVSGLFFIINSIFIILSQLYFFEGNIVYNLIILIMLILLTCGYFLAFGKCSSPISGSEIVIHFLLTVIFMIVIGTSIYYISFIKPTYTYNSIVGIVSTALFFNSIRLLSAKIKEKHLILSRFILVFGALMFFCFLIFGIANIFSPGIITNKL